MMTYSFTVPCANSAGAVDIWVSTGSGGTYEALGRSVNGVQISDNPYFVPVYSDGNGGEQGAPVDYQYLGKQGYLAFDCSQYDDAVAAKIRDRIPVTATFVPGMLVGCASAFFKVILYGPNIRRRYLAAIPLEPIQFNAGVVHSRSNFAFICNSLNGVIYDSTVSAVE